MQHTALRDRHRALGAKMTEFHGWEMPLYYTSILEEHQAVRQAVGVFDISHMGQVLVTGADAAARLNEIVVSDLSQVGQGRACYTLMLNPEGGVVDDLIIYRLGESEYLIIVNCANRAGDLEWLRSHLQGRVTVTEISEGRSMLAVQGPFASRLLESLLDAKIAGLGRFEIAPIRTMGPEACVARTGYTGGDGFELFLPDHHAKRLWDALLAHGISHGIKPIGLGARDTLRVEAGLRLYGADMDTATTPFEAGLHWTVAMGKPTFIGKDALLTQQREGLVRVFVGFELSQGPVPRTGMELSVADGDGRWRRVGIVTSGTFSPLLKKPLGMGYVEPAMKPPGTVVTLTVRNQRHAATVVKLPFWKAEAKRAIPTEPLLRTCSSTPEKPSDARAL